MIAPGTFQLGPENASLQVNTYREGVGAKVGHDLVIAVTRWEATIDLAADRAGSRGDGVVRRTGRGGRGWRGRRRSSRRGGDAGERIPVAPTRDRAAAR